jgi:hypothetical protein
VFVVVPIPTIAGIIPTTTTTHAIYNTHVGKINPVDAKETTTTSQYRRRGFNLGSLHSGPKAEDEQYYKQPGHPLSEDAKGSFKNRKAADEWSPN